VLATSKNKANMNGSRIDGSQSQQGGQGRSWKKLRGCENIERRSETVSSRSRQGALREK
jgi:hypothetical protein